MRDHPGTVTSETDDRLSIAAFSDSFAASAMPLLLMDAKLEILAVSAAAVELARVGGSEALLGRNWTRFIAPGHRRLIRQRVSALLGQRIIEGFVAGDELRLDGEPVAVSTWARRVSLIEGEYALVGLTPHRGEKLVFAQATERHFALVTTDHEWRIADASADAEGVFGVDHRGLAGLGLLGLLHPFDVANTAIALSTIGEDQHGVSLGVRLRSGEQWRAIVLTATRLCRHTPPRLACLLTPRTDEDRAQSERLLSVLSEAARAEIVPDLAVALRSSVHLHDLTARQWEIVTRLLRGETIAQISKGMFLSSGSVRNQLAELYRRFGVHSQAGLIGALLASRPDGEDA